MSIPWELLNENMVERLIRYEKKPSALLGFETISEFNNSIVYGQKWCLYWFVACNLVSLPPALDIFWQIKIVWMQ